MHPPTFAPRALPRVVPFLILMLAVAPAAPAQTWLPASPFPTWGAAPPASVTTLAWDPALSATGNGARLHAALNALTAGQGLAIGPGTWSVPNRLDLHGIGSAQAPIHVFALNPMQRPVITRPDAAQNAMNVGSNGAARYWVLRNLEITGGSDLVRLYDVAHFWLDGCYVHDGQGVGIAAMTNATSHVYVTRCEIARPGPGTNGEAIYVGGNFGAVVASDWVIAHNHVHDTRAAVAGQGDGIEIKQGSHRVWITGNRVHDCRNPCVLVYGTGGNGQNVIENNELWDSDDVVLQVQGEAIVRNNLALGGSFAFSSHDHQAQSRDLHVVHNTFVSGGGAASMQSWSGRPNMQFANNACYATGGNAIRFGNGSSGVTMAGNVAFGALYNVSGGYVAGAGLHDFVDVTLPTFHRDARPVVGGALDNRGSAAVALATDVHGAMRSLPADPGAFANANTLGSPTATIPLAGGGSQTMYFVAPPLAGLDYHVVGSLGGAGTWPGIPLGAFTVPLASDSWLATTLQHPNSAVLQQTRGVVAPGGVAVATLALPPLPAFLSGLQLQHVLIAMQGSSVRFVSNAVPVTLQ
jgi:hypothetical protein